MNIRCVWEHNGGDTLLYAADYPGAFARGASLDAALEKLPEDVRAYLRWAEMPIPATFEAKIVQEKSSALTIRDADSDVIFDGERLPLSAHEYMALKALALKSARDFQRLYDAVPDSERSALPPRETFYGALPRTAREMYAHTKNVNRYYFGEIGVDADNDGDIEACRARGFAALELHSGYLNNAVQLGSYDEEWSLRKLLRRFIWHDRIHARAMWRMARRTFGADAVPDLFKFENTVRL